VRAVDRMVETARVVPQGTIRGPLSGDDFRVTAFGWRGTETWPAMDEKALESASGPLPAPVAPVSIALCRSASDRIDPGGRSSQCCAGRGAGRDQPPGQASHPDTPGRGAQSAARSDCG
jgi:hypothetical protein